jgi:alpha-tubulin suppressor-like RCC1 family protein
MRLRSLLVPALMFALAPVSTAGAEVAGATDAPSRAAAAKLASGGLGTCAIDGTASVQCWGEDHDGQLLDGNDVPVGAKPGEGPVPIFLDRGVQVASVAYASSHACAVTTTGAVYCWGRDIYGQLGDASRGNSRGDAPGERAVKVAIPPASQIAVGQEHTCALLTDGSVNCWGGNVVGQLGRGSADDIGDGPGPVDLGGKKAIAISARGAHTCVIVEGNELRCWGSNGRGESGVVPASLSDAIGDQPGEVPVKPTVLTPSTGPDAPVAVSLGSSFTCVVTVSGKVRCWGESQSGQLLQGNQKIIGDTADETAVTIPTGGVAVKAIATGSETVCVIRTDNALLCWGKNDSGMLGTGLLGNNWGDSLGETTPLTVDLGAGRSATAVSIGIFHTCALLSTGTPLCWGASGSGQWGTGEKGGNNVKASARTPVTFSAALPDGDADGLPDRFDSCPAQAASTDDGCPLPVVVTPPPVVVTPPPVVPASDWPVTLKASKVTYNVLLVPSKSGKCPAKAQLDIRVNTKSKSKTTIKLKKTGSGSKARCRAKGSVKLKKAPDGGSLVTAKFSGAGIKKQTVVAERVA